MGIPHLRDVITLEQATLHHSHFIVKYGCSANLIEFSLIQGQIQKQAEQALLWTPLQRVSERPLAIPSTPQRTGMRRLKLHSCPFSETVPPTMVPRFTRTTRYGAALHFHRCRFTRHQWFYSHTWAAQAAMGKEAWPSWP